MTTVASHNESRSLDKKRVAFKYLSVPCLGSILSLVIVGCGEGSDPASVSDSSSPSGEVASPAVASGDPDGSGSAVQEPRDIAVEPCSLLSENEIQEVVGPTDVTTDEQQVESTGQGSSISTCEWETMAGTIRLSTYTTYTGTQNAERLLEYRASDDGSEESTIGDAGSLLPNGVLVFTKDDAFFELDVSGEESSEVSLSSSREALASTIAENYSGE